MHKFFTQNKLVQSPVDPCIYFRRNDDLLLAIVAVWVDDLIIGARNDMLLDELKTLLKRTFRMKDLGQVFFVQLDIIVFQNHNMTVENADISVI